MPEQFFINRAFKVFYASLDFQPSLAAGMTQQPRKKAARIPKRQPPVLHLGVNGHDGLRDRRAGIFHRPSDLSPVVIVQSNAKPPIAGSIDALSNLGPFLDVLFTHGVSRAQARSRSWHANNTPR